MIPENSKSAGVEPDVPGQEGTFQGSTGGGMDPADFMRRRRRASPILLVSPNILINCPPLHAARPFPTLHATDLTRPTRIFSFPDDSGSPASVLESEDRQDTHDDGSPRKKARLSKGSRPAGAAQEHSSKQSPRPVHKTFHLPLPVSITRLPYTFAPPILLSSSHDPRYFVAFFPRMGAVEAERAAGRSVPRETGVAPEMDLQNRDEGEMSGQAAGGPGTSPSDDEEGSPDEEGDPAPLGGILVLYTRPQLFRPLPPPLDTPNMSNNPAPAPALPTLPPVKSTYTHTFEVHSSYDIHGGGVIAVTWLFPPRRWVKEETTKEGDRKKEDFKPESETDADMNGNEDLGGNMDMDVDLDAVNGSEGQDQEPPLSRGTNGTNDARGKAWTPPILVREPGFGPRPINLSTMFGESGELARAKDPAFVILLSNHRIMLFYCTGGITPGSRFPQSAKPPQFGTMYTPLEHLTCSITIPSIAAASQGQTRDAPLSSDPTTYIKPHHSCLALRAADERIWIAYRSTRRARTMAEWRAPTGSGQAVGNGLTDPRRPSMYTDEPSPDVPLALSARIPQSARLGLEDAGSGLLPIAGLSMPAAGQDVSMLSASGLGGGDVQARAQTQGLLQGVGLPSMIGQPGSTLPSGDADWMDMLVEDVDDAGFGEIEEDWIHIAEARVSFVSAAVSIQVRPAPRIPISTAQKGTPSRLDSFAFTELPHETVLPDSIDGGTVVVQTSDGKRATDRSPYDPNRPLSLLLVHHCWDATSQKCSTRLDTHRLEQIQNKLSEAFTAIAARTAEPVAPLEAAIWVDWQSVSCLKKSVERDCLQLVFADKGHVDRCVMAWKRSQGSANRIFLSRVDTVSYEQSDLLALSDLKDGVTPALSVSNEVVLVQKTNRLIARTNVQSISHGLHGWAEALSLGLLQQKDSTALLQLMSLAKPKPDPGEVIQIVWQILQSQDFGSDAKAERPTYLLSLLRCQAECTRTTKDPSYRLAVTYMHLLSTELIFIGTGRNVPKRMPQQLPPNGTSSNPPRQELMRAYETDSLWLLYAQTDWLFELLQAIQREALIYDGADRIERDASYLIRHYPHLSLLFSQVVRNVLRRICNQAFAFMQFCLPFRGPIASHPLSYNPLPRDPSASQAVGVMMRAKIEDTGLRMDHMAKALADVQELLKDEPPNAEEGNPMVPPAGTIGRFDIPADKIHVFPRIVARLINDAQLIRSQGSLIMETTGMLQGDIVGHNTRDIITKEPLPGKMLFSADGSPLMEWRQCNRCSGRSVVYTSVDITSPGSSASGMMARKHGYIARSAWDREMRKHSANCICGGGWVSRDDRK